MARATGAALGYGFFLLNRLDEVEVKGLGDEVVGTDFLLELSLAGCHLLVEFLGGDRLFRTDGITDNISQGAVIHWLAS